METGLTFKAIQSPSNNKTSSSISPIKPTVHLKPRKRWQVMMETPIITNNLTDFGDLITRGKKNTYKKKMTSKTNIADATSIYKP